jgi:hypothetical protein
MVIGVMVLMKQVRIGTLYKLLGSVDSTRLKKIIVLEVDQTSIWRDSNRSELIQTDLTTHNKFNPTMLWHKMMGHIGEEGRRSMHNKGMVEEFPKFNLEFEFCKHFIYGKQIQVRFSSGSIRENGILELVHSDVFGPIIFPSLGASLYYVFVDYFSRKTWIYFLRNKS